MADVGEELQLGSRGLLLDMPAHDGRPIGIDHDSNQQDDDDTEKQEIHFLVVVLCQIDIHLAME